MPTMPSPASGPDPAGAPEPPPARLPDPPDLARPGDGPLAAPAAALPPTAPHAADPGAPPPLADGPARDDPHASEDLSRRFELARRLTARTPWTTTITLAMACVYAALVAEANRGGAEGGLRVEVFPEALRLGGAVTSDALERGDLFSLVTQGAVHVGFAHAALLLLAFHSTARLVERLVGPLAVLGSFALGSFAAGLVDVLSGRPAAGALGAILCMDGLLLAAVRGPYAPEGVPGGIRRSIVWTTGLLLVFRGLFAQELSSGGGLVAALAAPLAALALGLLIGLAQPPLLAPASPERLALARGAALAPLVLAGLLAVPGAGRVVLQDMGGLQALEGLQSLLYGRGGHRGPGGSGGPPSAHGRAPRFGPAAGVLKRVNLERVGVEVAVPAGWRVLEETKGRAALGPANGAPFLQVFSQEREPGQLGPDFSDPDFLLAFLKGEIERQGGEEVLAEPFERAELAGLPASRVDVRYRQQGMELRRISYVARGRTRTLTVVFLGLGAEAAAFAARLAPEVQIPDGERR